MRGENWHAVTSAKRPLSSFYLSYPLHRLSSTLFSFATDHAIVYEISFVPFGEVTIDTSDNLTKVDSFQLVVYLVSGTEPPVDTKVGITICNAVRIFFEENNTHILSYLCDSIDDRQAARKRKFDQWYNQFGLTLGIDKVDATIIVDNQQYLISLLVSENNSHKSAIKAEFLKSASSFNK